jgi:hypothetical protein
MSTCITQSGYPVARIEDEIHEFTNQDQKMTGLNFLDGDVVDVEVFVLGSDFVLLKNFEVRSIDIFMPTVTSQCPFYGSVVVTNDVGSQTFPVDPNVGLTILDDPADPIKTLESICGASGSYIDVHYKSDFKLEKNLDQIFNRNKREPQPSQPPPRKNLGHGYQYRREL